MNNLDVWLNGASNIDSLKLEEVAKSSTDKCNHLVAALSQLVVQAQSLSPEDQRRVRGFLSTASSILSSQAYLSPEDQKLFETSLRDATACARGGR